MDLLCPVCDRPIFENESEYHEYLATLGKKSHKSLYNKYTINNVNLDEVMKKLNDCISTHNKNFDFYFINCELVIEFDNDFTAIIQTNCFYNTDFVNIKLYLLYSIDCCESRGYKFYNINQIAINIIRDRCNMTCEQYINQPMSLCERKINMNIARNPQLIISLDRK